MATIQRLYLGGSDGVMEKENINNTIEDDLNRRNRNWDKISGLISDVDDLSSDVDGLISDVDDLINYVGDLETLTTDEKSTIVGALNEIDASHKTHLAESASKHITESGSNDDGYYIKFDDGTMICTATAIPDRRIKTDRQHFQMPEPFISHPSPSAGHASGASESYQLSCGTMMLTAISTQWTVAFTNTSETGYNYPMYLSAIGRWKE